MRRRLLYLMPLVLLVAACSLPSQQDMQGKRPIQITSDTNDVNILDRLGCVMGIQATGAGVIGTWRSMQQGQQTDSGLALMVTNDGVGVFAQVRNGWRQTAKWALGTSLTGAVTANDCRYTLFSGTTITYWCGSEHLLRKTNGVPMYVEEYDYFFMHSSCLDGWAYFYGPFMEGNCVVVPGWCIRYDDNG
jgi:hypothetical protein